MDEEIIKIRDKILKEALESVPFDGWSWAIAEDAATKAGFSQDMALAVFPGELKDVLIHFSDWADREMLNALSDTDPSAMRIRDRVQLCVQKRFEILEPHKEAVRLSSAYWIRPFRKLDASKIVWRTADQIWTWSGDTATDYNHYTKRVLLCGILTSTTLAWINDHSENMDKTLAFLDRRIENVMQLGKVIGSIKKKRAHD